MTRGVLVRTPTLRKHLRVDIPAAFGRHSTQPKGGPWIRHLHSGKEGARCARAPRVNETRSGTVRPSSYAGFTVKYAGFCNPMKPATLPRHWLAGSAAISLQLRSC